MSFLGRLVVSSALVLLLAVPSVYAQTSRGEDVAEIPPVTLSIKNQAQPKPAPKSRGYVESFLGAPSPAGEVLPNLNEPIIGLSDEELPTVEELNKRASDDAFQAAWKGLMPMSPAQIKELMRKLDETSEASNVPLTVPRSEVKVENVSLDPGVEPPTIELAVGFVTTMTILDATGQPWPIATVAVGGSFDIPQPEESSHILRITPLTRYGIGNMSVTLQGLATPVTFKLKTGTDVVYYRYDARIPRLGPKANIPLIQKSSGISAGDATIMAILDGVPPSGAERLDMRGTDARTSVWRVDERIFLRTPLKLLSPGWEASVSSADGVSVYEVMDAPVFLLSDNGVMVRASLALRETAYD